MPGRAQWTTERRVKPEFDNELPNLTSRISREVEEDEEEKEDEDEDSDDEEEVPGAFAVRRGNGESARESWDPTDTQDSCYRTSMRSMTLSRQPSAGLAPSASLNPTFQIESSTTYVESAFVTRSVADSDGDSDIEADDDDNVSLAVSDKRTEDDNTSCIGYVSKFLCQQTILLFVCLCLIPISVVIAGVTTPSNNSIGLDEQSGNDIESPSESMKDPCSSFDFLQTTPETLERFFGSCFCEANKLALPQNIFDDKNGSDFSEFNHTMEDLGIGIYPSSCGASTKAVFWLAASSTNEGISLSKMIPRFALAHFYLSFNGFSWFRSTNWLSSRDECEWFGVQCDNSSRVVYLELSQNKLRGKFVMDAAEVLGIINPKRIDFQKNELSGMLPLVPQMSSLEEFYVSDNQFTGTIPPAPLRFLTNLTSFNLDGNLLTGTLPENLFLLSNLRNLFITSQSNITGTIPETIGHLTNIKKLSISDLLLSGTLPTSIGLLTDVQHLYLGKNRLTGVLPTEIGMLTKMEILEIRHTDLTGTIPSTFFLLSNIKFIILETSNLGGSISTEIGRLTNLIEISLSWTSMTGTLPSEIGKLSALNAFLVGGNIFMNGTFPTEIASLPHLSHLDVLGTSLVGPVPDQLYNISTDSFVHVSCTMTCKPGCWFQKDCVELGGN